MRDNTLFKFGVTFLTGVFAITGSVVAQVDEIIVSAQKRETALVDTPVSVAVITSKDLELTEANDISELQFSVPSVKFTQNQNALNNTVFIRGFGNGTNNPGIEPSVSIVVDGVSRTRNQSALNDLISIEQVEVIRGPQSSLFGRSASAGVINIKTKLPENEFGGKVSLTGGNDNHRKIAGTLTGPLSDTTSFRLSASKNERDGYLTNTVTGNDINNRDRYAIRGQILSELSDELTMRIIADYDSLDEVCCGIAQLNTGLIDGALIQAGILAGRPPVGSHSGRFGANFDPSSKAEGRGVSAQFDLDLGSSTFSSITSYRENDFSASADVDFLPADILIESVDYGFETFTQEFQLKSDDSGDVRWMLGAYYMDEDIVNDRSVLFRDTAGIRNVVNTLLAIQQGPNLTQIAGLVGTGAIQQVAALPSATQAAAGFGNPLVPGTGLFVDANNQPVGAIGALTHPAFAPTLAGLVATFTGTSINDAWYVAGQGIQDTDFNVNTETVQLYGQLDWDLTENLTIDFTAAYIDDKKTVVTDVDIIDNFSEIPVVNDPATIGLTAIQFFPQFVNYPNANEDGVFESSEVTTSTKLIWSLDDDTNVYASYSTGFKPISVSVSTDPAVYAGQTFDSSRYFAEPEEVTLLEVGFKKQLDNGYINVTAFSQTIENFQSNNFAGTGFNLANAEEQENMGIEIDSMIFFSENFFTTLAVQYIDAEFVKHTFGTCDRTRSGDPTDDCAPGEIYRDISGTTPASIPDLSFSLSGNYRFDLSENTDGLLRIEYFHEAEHQATDTVSEAIAPRGVDMINAALNITNRDNGFSVTLWGRNINDDEFIQTAFNVPGSDSQAAYPAPGAIYGLTVAKEF
ncbi:MAG: TonB-dependent receptor [Candidatus Micropelagos thuwalensis]